MENPYRSAPDRAFWKRAVATNWAAKDLLSDGPILRAGDKVVSAGSCFAANIVPFIEQAGFSYIRTARYPAAFGDLIEDNFSYSKFSAAYGNVYTVRQAVQLLKRAMNRFHPMEDRWRVADDCVIDPFRPGLRYPAISDAEFDLVTVQHLHETIEAFKRADVFVFTLGLTEAWLSNPDCAVFPACPGTIAGIFDSERHSFRNFTVAEVSADLGELVELCREVNPRLRIVLTVSPVPLVATATPTHVLTATTYSKAVLRAAAGEASTRYAHVTYFPAYEIVTGPQAPFDFFEADRREPSAPAIREVMRCFLAHCETSFCLSDEAASDIKDPRDVGVPLSSTINAPAPSRITQDLSKLIADALCEEAALDIVGSKVNLRQT